MEGLAAVTKRMPSISTVPRSQYPAPRGSRSHRTKGTREGWGEHGAQYEHFRGDGFPYCPSCDEDELANEKLAVEVVRWFGPERPGQLTVEDFLRAGLRCLACGWKSKEWRE